MRQVLFAFLVFLLAAGGCATAPLSRPRIELNWKFLQSDAQGAQQAAFDDSKWQSVDLPHDWAIAGPFDEHAATTGSGAFLPSGVGWYRKHFTLPTSYEGKHFFIDFDGVMANSDVWINGLNLGHRPYGYSSFRYDLTGHLTFGHDKPNVLAVRADNEKQPASRWYSGAGIYRHVHFIVTDPIHFEHWGNFVTTNKNDVLVKSTVVNQSDTARQVFVQLELLDPSGKTVAMDETKPQIIQPGRSFTFQPKTSVQNPRLWNLDDPNLYSAILSIHSGNTLMGTETVPFGIRHFEFKADTGFWLNGKNFKLKGVCIHDDGGAFGAAVPMGVWERRLKALREIGANAIRTAHNPPDPMFLDLCDRMGFLVMDETFDCWTVAKNPFDYHLYFRDWFKTDARDMVLRDRNHPSIILYSAGNEIHDTPKPDIAKPILKDIVRVIHEADPTRPVTQALFRPNVSHDYDNGLADMLDVIGTNYRDNELIAAHNAKPERKIVGTENRHDRESWLPMRDTPAYSGEFLWTGVDYLGEARRWPIVGSGSGLVDRDGTPRPRGFERQSWWSDEPMVKMARRVAPQARTPDDPGFEPLNRVQAQFADWTPKNLSPHEETVEVYSNCESVELFLNGKSLGSQNIHADASARVWHVPFEPGALKAVAKNGDKVVANDELRTAGKAAKIVLESDHEKLSPSWEDVSYITARVVDENGVTLPAATNLVNFKITDPGVIAAVDNADNSSHESFQASERHAYQGVCYAVVKATAASGAIVVSASSEGLEPGTIKIEATPAKN
ncbi:MAG TPA: glycoside hydrolase family 2 TIM barrel-domain containing protein [Tepidisphaeraceae bacterium]|nr:glycoside hydrolase family 2 TIM barrel-domain containing protein [Tepidisphaeraceae bacterium]